MARAVMGSIGEAVNIRFLATTLTGAQKEFSFDFRRGEKAGFTQLIQVAREAFVSTSSLPSDSMEPTLDRIGVIVSLNGGKVKLTEANFTQAMEEAASRTREAGAEHREKIMIAPLRHPAATVVPTVAAAHTRGGDKEGHLA